ncbi:hypothetical protein JAAARDRAFT_185355 [Jaapia argillacea MUCL 33604]|uniref:F-box domain-containing protein n=1 Tax=Jaapia argillacea MUCL 33604 TaxID=933084 RepID=A0A067PB94_9AGAM|nr:hypothetical protein JAAARDRAFT_185355 [Jaapia argillacea MUCL 33604]
MSSADSSQSSSPPLVPDAHGTRIKITASNGLSRRVHSNSQSYLTAARKRAGTLALLPNLPLDVLFEIFSHLLPFDVLTLARTAKDLRRLLMHRTARPIWKATFKNIIHFPECADDLSEPQYVNLAFSPHCHNCLANGVDKVDWFLRVRFCVECAKKCLLCDTDPGFPKEIAECLPDSSMKWPDLRGKVYRKQDVVNLLQKLNAQPTEVARQELIERTKAKSYEIACFAEECQEWEDDYKDHLRYEAHMQLIKLKDDRKKAIIERLTALGWGEEIKKLPTYHKASVYKAEPFYLFDEHPLVCQHRALTDRMWRNIEEEMVEYMEDMRDYRLEQEAKSLAKKRKGAVLTIYEAYKESHPALQYSDVLPSPADICNAPRVKHLLQNLSIAAENFDEHLPDLGSIIDEWQTGAKSTLRKISGNDRLDLDLATSVYACKTRDAIHYSHLESCLDYPDRKRTYESLWYPQVAHHRCNGVERFGLDEADEEMSREIDPSTKIGGNLSSIRRRPWSAENLTFDKKALRVMQNIIESCGLDPKQTTPAKLDILDARLVCLKCSYGRECDGERRLQVRAWRKMVIPGNHRLAPPLKRSGRMLFQLAHCMVTHWGDSTIKYEKIIDADVGIARLEEKKQVEKHPTKAHPMWECKHCYQKPRQPDRMSTIEIDDHLDLRHLVTPGVKDHDYFRALDAAPEEPPAIYMVPRATKVQSSLPPAPTGS